MAWRAGMKMISILIVAVSIAACGRGIVIDGRGR